MNHHKFEKSSTVRQPWHRTRIGPIAVALFLFIRSPNAVEPPEVLTRISDVKDLPIETARVGRPVQLKGVVTYLEPDGLIAFMQDASGGIYFKHRNERWNTAIDAKQGEVIEIEGLTTPGQFAPYVIGPEFMPVQARILGQGEWPAPIRLGPDELLNPAYHSEWIELRASIRSLDRDGPDRQLVVSTPAGGLKAKVRLPAGDVWSEAIQTGALVRMQGVFGSLYNEERELRGVRLFVPSPKFVRIEEPGGDALWRAPVRAIEDLLQFKPPISVRARVQGVVTGIMETGFLFLRDESKSLRVQTVNAPFCRLGDRLDLVGIVSEENGHATLNDAFVRRMRGFEVVEPLRTTPEQAASGRRAFELVRIQGAVVDTLIHPRSQILLLQSGARVFQARLDGSVTGRLQIPPRESVIEATGVCVHEIQDRPALGLDAPSKNEAASGFTILLRSASDIRLLQGPPFWTLAKLFCLLGGVLAILLGAAVWIRLLRLRVARQTSVIRDTLRRESVLAERSRIARELHDTLEQDLAGVQLQLDAATKHFEAKPRAAQGMLAGARKLLRYCRDEAKRSVMDLRSAALEQPSLESALQCLFQNLHGAKFESITVRAKGAARRLDAATEHNLLRVAQEAVHNAFDHGAATRILVELNYETECLSLIVRDDGKGFDPRGVETSNGCFGVLGMRERAERCGGAISIKSAPGNGAEVSLRIPIPIGNADHKSPHE